jgi:CHAT domain-containing protein
MRNQILKLLTVLIVIIFVVQNFESLAAEQPKAPSGKAKIDENVLQQIFALTERPATPEAIDKMLKTEEEAAKFKNNNEIDKALVKFQEVYGLSKEIKNGDGEGRALTNMSQIYYEKGQLIRAKELAENAVEVLAGSRDKKSLGKANIVLSQIYFALDNTLGSITQLDNALKCFTDLTAKDSAETARIMIIAGSLASSLGNHKQTALFLKGASACYGQANDTQQQLNVQISLARGLVDCGLFTVALEEANQALYAANNSKKPELVAIAKTTVGNCEYALGEYAKALKTFEEALSIKVPGQTPAVRASMEVGYVLVLSAIGDLDQAKTIAERILPTVKAHCNALDHVCLLNALGVIESQKGNYAKALPLFKDALDLQSILKPRRDRLAIIIMQNQATAESHIGENRNAKEHLATAVGALTAHKYRNPQLLGQTYAALAEVSYNLKEIPQAQEYIAKSIEASTKISDDATLWRDYTNLARIQNIQGEENAESLKSAISFFRSPQAGYFPAPDRSGFPLSREELGQELVFLLIDKGMVEEAILVAEQLKEDFFITEWLKHGGEVKPTDREIYHDLANERMHLHIAEITTTPDKLTEGWQNWLKRFRQLAAENQSLASLIAPVPLSISETVKLVQQSNKTVIDYLVGSNAIAAFAIDSKGTLYGTRIPIGKQELQNQVQVLISQQNKNRDNAGEANRQLSDKRLLQLLYNELLPEQYQTILPNNPDQTIVIVPDSVLFNLPFAALVGTNGKYLVEDHTLTMTSSLRSLLNSPTVYGAEMSVLIAGGSGASESRANQETTMISNVYEPDQIIKLIGKDAEINNLQEQAKNKVVFHIAESISFADTNPFKSRLSFLSSGEDRSPVMINHLFGLALPSSLAVLSGTSINTKDSSGRGVNLFSRGLNYAGIRNVLMSLWLEPEPDRTDELLEFYRGRQQGLNQAQSLRKAQLLALSKDSSVHNWAAFQLIGPGN